MTDDAQRGLADVLRRLDDLEKNLADRIDVRGPDRPASLC